ncbi:ubiquitin specific protease 2 isoform X1 [Leptinotarsa decemlineata]|uniref:ubiquitin specific protease 2 isoform X1 n=1 Tax=Leptinotarsa decemlineata TaxID=7539 RepID=UPI003D307FBB
MPVLSPHRSSASGLSGSYRSTFSSPPLDRQYYSPPSYNPRITSFSERFTSRSYTDSDGRRVFSRSGSVIEDGVTTSRFREESREPSLRRDSISRDSGISSIRENSVLEYPRRESSLTRSDRLSTVNVIDSVAELRNKYSPSNYVPKCYRKNENISRSKSINDIGLPPIEAKASKKKVNERVDAIYTNSLSFSNNTNANNLSDEDDNGNRASVADLCKKFDEKPLKIMKSGTYDLANKTTDIKSRPSDPTNVKLTNGKSKVNGVKKSTNGVSNSRKNDGMTSGKCQSNTDVLQTNSKLEVNEEPNFENGTEINREKVNTDEVDSISTRSNSRVNNFASYIPTKDYQKGDENKSDSSSKNDMDNKDSYIGKILQQNELSTSPKLTRSAISPSNSVSSSLTSNSLSRRSSDRENHRIRDYSEDSSGERSINSYNHRPVIHSSVKTLGLNGLKNIGNTCFMNSVIQCLSNTRWLLEYLKKDAYMKDINTSISSMKGALIKAFAEVIKELWSEDSSDRVVNTVSLKSQIQRFAPRFMGYAQQDAQEFLRYLLEGLHEDVNRITEKPKPIITEIDEKLSDNEKAQESWLRYLRMDNSKIVDNFVGQLKSTLRCTHCGHSSVTFDPFWDLSLPIPQRTGQLRLSQCLDSFTREETLDGDEKPTCSRCKERRKCTKSLSIHKFPRILVIHLKRFSPTERFRGKLNVAIDFPLEGLDMSNYAADNVAPFRYNLYALSNHSGTTYSGHYTAYCRHPYTGTWHEYNDSRVSPISPKSLVSGEAYVLFYEQDGTKSHL